jgi:hypothetical protein
LLQVHRIITNFQIEWLYEKQKVIPKKLKNKFSV